MMTVNKLANTRQGVTTHPAGLGPAGLEKNAVGHSKAAHSDNTREIEVKGW